jgi:transcriptional regulator with XRE-family HTH domain
MPHVPNSKATAALLKRMRRSLELSQGDVARLLGLVPRTIGRWETCESNPGDHDLRRLAVAIHPRSEGFARELAEDGGTTLEALGLPVAAPVAPARAFPPVALVVDAIVFAAAEAIAQQGGEPLSAARAALRSGIARARVLGLTLEEVDDALAAPPAGPRDGRGQGGQGASGPASRKAAGSSGAGAAKAGSTGTGAT